MSVYIYHHYIRIYNHLHAKLKMSFASDELANDDVNMMAMTMIIIINNSSNDDDAVVE